MSQFWLPRWLLVHVKYTERKNWCTVIALAKSSSFQIGWFEIFSNIPSWESVCKISALLLPNWGRRERWQELKINHACLRRVCIFNVKNSRLLNLYEWINVLWRCIIAFFCDATSSKNGKTVGGFVALKLQVMIGFFLISLQPDHILGNGYCKCGKCHCTREEYSGKYCDVCPTCTDDCNTLKPCVECKAFENFLPLVPNKGSYTDVCFSRLLNEYSITNNCEFYRLNTCKKQRKSVSKNVTLNILKKYLQGFQVPWKIAAFFTKIASTSFHIQI